METISISPRFFTHELNTYSDWEKAFWRELVQNSVDAECSKIEISVIQEDGRCKVSFFDNGPGMDETTLRDIYFQLGATGKEGADTIGGHGRARILTCFAHESYSIRTQNLLCSGKGGHFEIDAMQPLFKGCCVSVVISTTSAEEMERALKSYLKNCQLPCQVSVNGENFTEWLYRRRASRILTFGTVHTTKHVQNTTVARVRGVSMFERYTGCPTGTILEVEADKARTLLTVSRDSLKYDAQKELDAFITEITLNSKSINRDCATNKTEVFGRFRRVAGKKGAERERERRAAIAGTQETSLYGTSPAYAAAAYGAPSGDCTVTELEPAFPAPVIPYSVHYEDAPKSIASRARRFHPELISGKRLKLLAAWDATIQFVLEAIEEWRGEEILFLPGFAFGSMLGLHKEENTAEGEGHILYINPINSSGNIRVSCHNYAELYATAVHECTHVLRDYHDEEYASLITELTARTAGKMQEMKTRIREAVAEISKTGTTVPDPATEPTLVAA
jgi:hypothetical protein